MKKDDIPTIIIKGVYSKDNFYPILNFIDILKQEGWVFVSHHRKELEDNKLRINYKLEKQ